MLFNSLEFLFVFLPVVVIGFACAAQMGRSFAVAWLVAASLAFYSWWNPPYLVLLGSSILANFLLGRWLLVRPSRLVLGVGVALNLALLGYFKYALFFADILADLTGATLYANSIVLPLAISFFTFQQISYLVEAHRALVKSYGLAEYALFVSFFPHLIAGPIVRPSEILAQIATRLGPLKLENLTIGTAFFLIGLFKKVVLADGVASYATTMFDAAARGEPLNFVGAWSGALAYTLQIYFDFSGYSDMAVGLARMFGIRFPVNFNSPYQALSIIEFWRRWHISLSRFLRDFLYVPLGGNRQGELRRYVNLACVMLLGGLWHGAAWTFVIWGGLHGALLVINQAWRQFRSRYTSLRWRPSRRTAALSWALTFLSVVVAWVFFRAESFGAAWAVLSAMFGGGAGVLLPATRGHLLDASAEIWARVGVRFTSAPIPHVPGWDGILWIAALLLACILLPNSQHYLRRWHSYSETSAGMLKSVVSRFTWRPTMAHAVVIAFLAAAALGRLASPSPFLYFQF